MVISKQLTAPKCNIKIGSTTLNQVDKFKYLRTMITSVGKSDTEIKSRIAQSKQTFETEKYSHKQKNGITC